MTDTTKNLSNTPSDVPSTAERVEAVLAGPKEPEQVAEQPIVRFTLVPGKPETSGDFKGQVTKFWLKGVGVDGQSFQEIIESLFYVSGDVSEAEDPEDPLEPFLFIHLGPTSIFHPALPTPDALQTYAEGLQRKLEDPQVQKRIIALHQRQRALDDDKSAVESELTGLRHDGRLEEESTTEQSRT